MTPILQKTLPFAPWMDPRTWRLPGIVPLTDDGWIAPDDAYAGQMAERDRDVDPLQVVRPGADQRQDQDDDEDRGHGGVLAWLGVKGLGLLASC